MASFAVCSIQKICGALVIVALAAWGTWEDPKPSQLESILLRFLDEQDASTVALLAEIEEWMAPGFGALPKHQGRLGPLAARHLLHGFFNSHYGLNIAGLGFHNSQQESDVEAVEDLALVKDRAPKLHLALAKEAPSVHGLSLRELAVYAAVLQRLVLREARIAFKVAWRLRNHSVTANLKPQELHEVLSSSMLLVRDWDKVLLQPDTLKRAHPMLHERFRLVQEFATNQTEAYRSLQSFVAVLAQKMLPSAPPTSFKAALPAFLELFLSYGAFQNMDCQDMKTTLRRLDPARQGRVWLRNFYSEKEGTKYWFREAPKYLHKLGALDSRDPDVPFVVATNYVDGINNCLAPNAHFSICCISDCTGLLRVYESTLQAPAATVQQLLVITRALSASTVSVNLTEQLESRLHDIAKITGGRVALHGRLFAEWLHYLEPYRCPMPQIPGAQVHWYQMNSAMSTKDKESYESGDFAQLPDLSARMLWSEEEVFLLGSETESVLSSSNLSWLQCIAQVVVIFTGLNDLIWLCMRPRGKKAQQEEQDVQSKKEEVEDVKRGEAKAKAKSQEKRAPRKAQPKEKRKSKKLSKDESAESGEESCDRLEWLTEVFPPITSLSFERSVDIGLRDESDSAMTKAAARVATSRAAAAAAVAAAQAVQAEFRAAVPEARSVGLEALYRGLRKSSGAARASSLDIGGPGTASL